MNKLVSFQVTKANNVIFYASNTRERQRQLDDVDTFMLWETPLERVRVKYGRSCDPVLIHKKARTALLDQFGVHTIGDLIRATEVNFASVRDLAKGEHCFSFNDHFRTFVASMKRIPSYDPKGADKIIRIPVRTNYIVVNSDDVDGLNRDDVDEIAKVIDEHLKQNAVAIVQQGTEFLKRKKLEETRAKLALLEDQVRELEESLQENEVEVA